MTIQGRIYSKSTGQTIPGKIIASHPTDGLIGTMDILSGEDYTLEGEPDYLAQVTLIFASKGFASTQRNGWQLVSEPNIYLEPGASGAAALAAVGIAIIALQRKKKQVGKLETKDVFPFLIIAAGILAWNVINKLLEWLGIKDSRDTKDLDAASTNPNSFWNPNFWTTKPADQAYTSPITESTAESWANEIYNAFGAFNDDEEVPISVFKRCYSQATASFVCWKFQKIYNQDLLKFLRGGIWPQDRLSDADVNEINTYVQRLPKY